LFSLAGFTTPPDVALSPDDDRLRVSRSRLHKSPLKHVKPVSQIPLSYRFKHPDSSSGDSLPEAADITGKPSLDDLEYIPDQQNIPEEGDNQVEAEESGSEHRLTGWGLQFII
jgi:hypothetical protein